MSEKRKDEDGLKRKSGGLQGYGRKDKRNKSEC